MPKNHFHEANNRGLDVCLGYVDIDRVTPVSEDTHFYISNRTLVQCGLPYGTGDLASALGNEYRELSAVIVDNTGKRITGTPLLAVKGYHISPYGTFVLELV